MKSNNQRFENIYISGPSGIGKSKFAKDLAKKNNIRNGKSKNFVYTAPTAKNMVTYDFIDSEYKAQDVTIFDDIDQHHLVQEFHVFDRDNITKILQNMQIKHGFSHYAIITKASSIKIGLID